MYTVKYIVIFFFQQQRNAASAAFYSLVKWRDQFGYRKPALKFATLSIRSAFVYLIVLWIRNLRCDVCNVTQKYSECILMYSSYIL